MKTFDLRRRLCAEGLGTGLLLVGILGSGIMAERLAHGDVALALLANALATGAILLCLIYGLSSISGAHFNPVVSINAAMDGDLSIGELAAYIASQVVGACLGAILANLMFGSAWINFSQRIRSGPALWLSEVVATFGLLLIVRLCAQFDSRSVAVSVAAYITGAYWFTSSTSFANPAVTIARTLSNSFAGIRAVDAPAFIIAQLLGCAIATFFITWILSPTKESASHEAQRPIRLHPQ